MRAFRQKKDLLMRTRWPIPDALGHDVGLFPNLFAAQMPSIIPKSERKHPWYADEILRLQTRNALCRVVAVRDVDPAHAIGPEDATDLAEYFDKMRYEQLGSWL